MQHENRGGRGAESERQDSSRQWPSQPGSWANPSNEGSSFQDENRRYGQDYGSGYGPQNQGMQYGQGSQRGWSPAYGSHGHQSWGWGGPSQGYGLSDYGQYGPARYGPSGHGQGSTGGYGPQGQGGYGASGYGQSSGGQPASSGTNWGGGYGQSGFGSAGSGLPVHGGSSMMPHHPDMRSRRGPKGYQRSDDRLREEVIDKLLQQSDIELDQIEVNVTSGSVTLSGTIDSRRVKHLIEDIVDSVWGVKDISNNLRIQSAREGDQPGSGGWGGASGRSGSYSGSSGEAGGSRSTGDQNDTSSQSGAGPRGLQPGQGSSGTSR